MGLNTTVIVLNDRLGDIEKDDRLGPMLAISLKQGKARADAPDSVGNGVYVVETHHADDTAVVLVGGNTARVLTYLQGIDPNDVSDVLKELANWEGIKRQRVQKPSLEEVKQLAKDYGWRCIILRRKTKPMKVLRKKIS